MPTLARFAVLAALVCTNMAFAAQIGVIPPVEPLTAERVAALPAAERAAWQAYLARSGAQRAADKAALATEREGLASWPGPPESGHGEASMPLDRPAAWYGSDAALQVARNILSFQTPAGGWGKNQPRDRAPRQRGQAYVADNSPRKAPPPGDFDLPVDAQWSYVGTIDNDATITEIRFLALVAARMQGEAGEPFRQGVRRGMAYLLAAQFPNGGWPQVWPLQGGYHDTITLNDNALVEVAELMGWAARGEVELGFLPAPMRAAAEAAQAQAVQLLLATQVRIGGRPLLWAQQYDALALAPASARNYEPPALSIGESARVLDFLMRLPQPSPAVLEAVGFGIATLRELAVYDRAWVKLDEAQGRRLVDRPGAGPLWARYYDARVPVYRPSAIRPVFGDRDKSLHDDVNDISLERRNGYAWWGTWPLKTLEFYDKVWAPRCVKHLS